MHEWNVQEISTTISQIFPAPKALSLMDARSSMASGSTRWTTIRLQAQGTPSKVVITSYLIQDPMAEEEFDLVYPYCRKPVLVMGAGNILFGDDGFGPAVIEELEKRDDIPDFVHLLDVGSGARNFLFNIVISEKIPEIIILVDTVLEGQGPGKVFEIDLDDLPVEKSDDFQFHLVPTSNMMRDLKDQRGVNLIIIACEAENIPEVDMYEGLSDKVRAAVLIAADLIIKKAKEAYDGKAGP